MSTNKKWISGVGVVALVGVTGALIWLHQADGRLEGEIATLRGQQDELRRTPQKQPPARSANVAVAPPPTPVSASPAQPAEKPAPENRDPEKGMVRVELLANAGRATPAATLQTLIWAAMQGQDAELAASLDLSGSAREKAEAWLASLPEDARAKYPRPESLPALFLTEEMVRKAASIQVIGLIDEAGDRATVRAQTTTRTGRVGESKFPMQRSAAGWRLVIPEKMIDGMRQSAARMEAGAAPKE